MGEIFPEHPVSPVIPQDGEIQAEIPPLLQGKEPKAPPWAEMEPGSWGRGTPGETSATGATLLLPQLLPEALPSQPVVFLSWGVWRWALPGLQGVLFGACLSWARRKVQLHLHMTQPC